MSGLDDNDLVTLNIRDLNKTLKSKGISKEDVDLLKKRRRTLLNRGKFYIDCQRRFYFLINFGLLLKISEWCNHYFLGYAKSCRVRRQTEEESLENANRELQEELDRGIAIDGEYFPTYESVVEKYAQSCHEAAHMKYICRKAGLEDWVSDEDDLDDSTKEEIRMILPQNYTTVEFNQD